MNNINELLRKLPSIDKLLKHPEAVSLTQKFPREIVVSSLREVIENKRNIIRQMGHINTQELREDLLIQKAEEIANAKTAWTLRRVVNATGVIVHTNLGRSLLPDEAIRRIASISSGYNNLEYDLEKGCRGSRYVHAEKLLRELTGAEAALVVNNNAAAVFLVLNTIAKGREVIVSRGELVEIGGSFRIPDVMASSGAILKEVGCTNKTHLSDYELAINENTIAILKVHKSNYKIVGFTDEVSLSELVETARKHNLYCLEDMGSGCFVDLTPYGIKDEPTVRWELQTGVHVITFSGDKLLGGPQAGIILGKKEIIEKCKKNPMTRAFRVDKLTLSALEATLKLYLDEEKAKQQIPTLQMISASIGELEKRAGNLAEQLKKHGDSDKVEIKVEKVISRVGGGAAPTAELPSRAVTISSHIFSPQTLEHYFRTYDPPIIIRIENNKIYMDVRTLLKDDDDHIVSAFQEFMRNLSSRL